MKIIISLCFLVVSYLISASFPIDASSCSSSARQLKNSADDLEYKEQDVDDKESELQYAIQEVENAKSNYELNCGAYGSFSKDESICGSWGMYKQSYDNAYSDYEWKKREYNSAVDDYNSALSDVAYQLRRVLNSCQ